MSDELNEESKAALKHHRIERLRPHEAKTVDVLREEVTLMAASSMIAGLKYILAMTLDTAVSHEQLRESVGEVAVRLLVMTGHMKDFVEQVDEYQSKKIN